VDEGDGDAVRFVRVVAAAVVSGLLAAAGTAAGVLAAGVLVAEPSGRRTLALPVVPVEELFRVWVFTARAVDPVTRIPAIDRAKADRVLMP
jgi:hypothetical protein